MDIVTHTCLALGCMAACYFWGRYLSKREILEDVTEKILMSLEEGGFIKTTVDADGDVELIPIAEIIKEDRIANSN